MRESRSVFSLLAGRTGVVSLGYEEEAVDLFTGSVAFGLQ